MTDSHMAAKNIVSKYTLYAAGAGLVPIPVLDLAALAAGPSAGQLARVDGGGGLVRRGSGVLGDDQGALEAGLGLL